MQKKDYASAGIAKFKQRMQQAQTSQPALQRSKTPPLASVGSANQAKPVLAAPKASVPLKPASKVQKPASGSFKKKMSMAGMMGFDTGAYLKKQKQEKIEVQNLDEEASTGVPKADHHGKTASFAIDETFAKIQAKIESAQRREKAAFKSSPLTTNSVASAAQKKVNAFEPMDPIEDHFSQEASDDGDFKKPNISGRTSRSKRTQRNSTPTMQQTLVKSNVHTPVNMGDDNLLDEDFANQTPSVFGSGSVNSKKTRMGTTDEQGNRLSNLPGEERPSLESVTPYDDNPEKLVEKVEAIIEKSKKEKSKQSKPSAAAKQSFNNALEQLNHQKTELLSSKAVKKNDGLPMERQNFVKQNTNKGAGGGFGKGGYKPALRGAAFTNKIMAKKKNNLKFRDRMKRKILAEKAAQSVGAYGGLGARGLDFGDSCTHEQKLALRKELECSFSGAALKYAPQISLESDDEEEADKNEGIPPEDIPDVANYTLGEGDNDEIYKEVLQEKFGHEEFREGQEKAIKIVLEEKRNSLVVLATGGGKSLCYQFMTQFLPGLVLVVTPLISLMTDQLQKLPDFIPGASLNSQQSYPTKQAVIKAVQEKKIKVLFITPERLFMEDLSKFGREISMVCVDEIHSASEWSHNFRPAYLVLHDMIKDKLGENCRVIGLTATATRAAQRQICNLFDVKFPEHIVTQTDLSRMNLQLSITRDREKSQALISLLRSPGYKGLTSILLFATARYTTQKIAQLLNQQGFNAAFYHGDMTPEQRSKVQDDFINNRVRVLCATIAFSMGIDKSDIQAVIHYDMPRSIENYVQEIGRAGRDGSLARCHMFLNNSDYYLLRRLSLRDILDDQSAHRLTNIAILEAKRQYYQKFINDGEKPKASKKRKLKDMESDSDDEAASREQLMEQFDHEDELKSLYQAQDDGFKFIPTVAQEEKDKMYVAVRVSFLKKTLDLEEPVILTMLNQLQNLPAERKLFKINSTLPGDIQLRFYSKQLEELQEDSPHKKFYQAFASIATNRQGTYRCSLLRLASILEVKPYFIPKMLFQIQHSGLDEMAYEMDRSTESFILEFSRIPHQSHVLELSETMLQETRVIEKNIVSKLNCMFFAARRVSLPSIEAMGKKERMLEEEGTGAADLYFDFSQKLNKLINTYFSAERGEDVEIKIAGNGEERAALMPLLYLFDEDEQTGARKENDEAQRVRGCMEEILASFHKGERKKAMRNPANRMKPVDVVKVLMGIQSTRECVNRFRNGHERLYAQFSDYDYDQLIEVASDEVHRFYISALEQDETDNVQAMKDQDSALRKLRKLN